MKTVSIINMGCKVNQYECDTVAGILAGSGFSVHFGLVSADVYFVNTCAVTNEGERKSRNVLTKLTKLNPNAKIYVAGCASQNNKNNFVHHPNVVYVIGTENKNLIAQKICQDYDKKMILNDTHISNRTRGVLKCQDGCNNFCTYCLIPYLRGREKSRSLSELYSELSNMQKAGVHEVVLTGINLSGYGSDFGDGTNLIDVAKLIHTLNEQLTRPYRFTDDQAFWGIRYRFSSLEVGIISKDFLEYLSRDKFFCPHFHLSMQSGCNKTLKSMNRHYTKEEYLQKVALIREYFPLAAITTDVIVGFPTETEEDFAETVETCKKANFFEIHVFPYSLRAGTAASKMKNVATKVKDRVWILKNLVAENHDNFIVQNIQAGGLRDIIIETTDGDYYTGHTDNYIKCYIKKDSQKFELHNNEIWYVKFENKFLDGVLCSVESVACINIVDK